MREFDAIVVGVGGMGSATVYHLAHEFGSSHGTTRIQAGERLLFVTGCVDAGGPDSATVRGSLETCRQFALKHLEFDARSLHEKFSGYRLPDGMAAVLQPDGGFLLPEACIVNHVKAAQACGAEIHARERVLGWGAPGGAVEVRTEQETYRARKLLITAGPWASQFCPMLQKLAVPERQVVLKSFRYSTLRRPRADSTDVRSTVFQDSRSGNITTGARMSTLTTSTARFIRKMNSCCARESDDISRTPTVPRWR